MKVSSHIAGSAAAACGVYLALGAAPAAACMASGVLLDLDHVTDYIILSGEKWSVNGFMSWCYDVKWNRIYLWFHSYEFMAVAVAAGFALGSAVYYGIIIGAVLHLLMDQFGNRGFGNSGYRIVPQFYFLSFRWKNGFLRDRLMEKRP